MTASPKKPDRDEDRGGPSDLSWMDVVIATVILATVVGCAVVLLAYLLSR